MTYMLDTNMLIYLIKNKPASVADRINAFDSSVELCMSFFTFAELLKGAERSTRKPGSHRTWHTSGEAGCFDCQTGRIARWLAHQSLHPAALDWNSQLDRRLGIVRL